MSHDDQTRPLPVGQHTYYQAKCMCGWTARTAQRSDPKNSTALLAASLQAHGDWYDHMQQAEAEDAAQLDALREPEPEELLW